MVEDKKIKDLLSRGYNKYQASLIVKMQQGGWYNTNPNFSNNFAVENNGMPKNYPQPSFQKPIENSIIEAPANPNYTPYNYQQQDLAITEATLPIEQKLKKEYLQDGEESNQKLDFSNIFAPVGLEQSLYTLGQGLGQKDPYTTGLGAGLSALKIARTGLAGYASGKENKRVYDEFYDKLYEDNRRPQMLQEGGKTVTNAEAMTGKFIVDTPDNPNNNVELEKHEFVKDEKTGEIKKVIGEKHTQGGVQTQLDEAKILSNYTKIGAKNAKELKEKYQLSIKSTDTFAKVMDKLNKKLGVDEAIQEQAKAIEDFGKNNSVKDATTKRLNETVLTKEIQEYELKLEELKGAQNFVFEDIFKMQEQIPKKGNSKDILDSKGKPMAQEGGVFELAKQFGISPERAQELLVMQEGGEMMEEQSIPQEQQINPEQIMQMVAESLQQGADPNEVAQQLLSMNIPQEQVQQIIETVMQQMQPQQEPIMAQEGGTWQDKLKKDYKYGKEAENNYVKGAFEEPDYTFESTSEIAKRFKFLADQRGIDYSNLDLNTRSGVDKLASLTQQFDKKNTPGLVQDYGMSIGLTRQGINYFVNTPTFKQLEKDNPNLAEKLKNAKRGTYDVSNFSAEDRNTIMGKVKASGDENFADKNYLDNEAFFRGIDKQKIYFKDKEEFEKYKKDKGESTNGYYKTDKKGVYVKPILLQPKEFKTPEEQKAWEDKYGKNTEAQHQGFYSEDPNADVYYTPSASTIPASPTAPQYKENEIVNNPPQTKTVGVGSEYVPFILPPSAMQPIAKPYVPLDRIEPIKQTVEPYLAEAERQRQTAQEQVRATGLPPQIQEALQAQQLASSQLSSNDAISKVETFNAQNQFQADQFNIGQAGKEDLLNAQFNQDYQDKMMQTVSNQERDLRSYFNNWNNFYQQKQQDNFNRNAINMQYENKQINPDGTVSFVAPTTTSTLADNTEYYNWYDKLSPQDQLKETERRTNEMRAKSMQQYYSKTK